jgi:hypothetical protein
VISSPSENGYVFFWAQIKPTTKEKWCFWKTDKKHTNRFYEYMKPFAKKSRLKLFEISA